MTNDKKKLFERRNIWKKNRNKIIQESSWEFGKKKEGKISDQKFRHRDNFPPFKNNIWFTMCSHMWNRKERVDEWTVWPGGTTLIPRVPLP